MIPNFLSAWGFRVSVTIHGALKPKEIPSSKVKMHRCTLGIANYGNR